MAYLRQIVNSQVIKSINVKASADDLDALKSVMVGKIEEWKTKATGGTATAIPDVLNTQRWVARKGHKSCAFRIHHINPKKTNIDIEGYIIGKFDVGFYDGAEKCDEAYPIYKRNKN